MLDDRHQIVVNSVENVGMKVSFAEVFEHADGEETRLRAADRDESVVAIHRLNIAWLCHAATDADRSLFDLLLIHHALACSSASLRVAVRVRVFAFRIGNEVLTGLRVQCVAEFAYQHK